MPYQRLTAWRAAHDLAVAVYEVTRVFPKSELYGVTSQLRRAAFSVPANIAEGASKRGSAEFRRYLDIALGSHAEVSYAIHFAHDVGLLDDTCYARLEKLRISAGKLTWGLYNAISQAVGNGSRQSNPRGRARAP
jgi:four helix bundle protein